MAFLPIVERELRVASRRKATHRIRLWTTLAGLLVSFCFILASAVFGRRTPNIGQVLFNILTYYAFGLSLLAGVFLAADCVSEEKREGTLGLLFLTDLKGYDVVLGKLMAVGLSALYGLVAVLPVTGLPLLLGGVTGAEYWRVSLALVNTLFFSLATGILVSTWSREATRAMGNTLGLLVIAVVGLPLLGGIMSVTRLPADWWYLTSLSPFYAFSYGAEALMAGHPGRYWICLLASHGFAWFMLVLACWWLPRAWQDKPFRRQMISPAATRGRGPTGARFIWPDPRRARLLDLNPILWLAGSNSGMWWRFWAVPLSGMALVFAILQLSPSPLAFAGATYFFWLLGFVMKSLVAFQACRFFVDARRSGALELILSTPLTSREIIRGQWLALKRLLLWPVVVLLVAHLLLSVFQIVGSARYFNSSAIRVSGAGVRGSITPFVGFFQGRTWPILLLQSGSLLYQLTKSVADYLAVGWVGMWLGLSTKKPNLAAAFTILFVVIIPMALVCVPSVVIDLVFILWARQKLLDEFRRTAMPQYPSAFNRPSSAPIAGTPPIIGR